MTFNAGSLSVIVQPIGGEGLRFYSYKTDDPVDVVTAEDYFTNAARFAVQLGDLIFVGPQDGIAESYVTVVRSIDSNGNVTAFLGASIASDIHLHPTGGDDYTLLQGTFDTLKARGVGNCYLHGAFKTSQMLRVEAGFRIIGESFGTDILDASGPGPTARTQIEWIGPNNLTTPIMWVKSATPGNSIYGGSRMIDNISFRGTNTAYGCLRLSSLRHYRLGYIWVERARNYHVLWDTSNAIPDPLYPSTDHNFPYTQGTGGSLAYCGWEAIHGNNGSHAATQAADGLIIKTEADWIGTSHIFGGITDIKVTTGISFYLGDCDESHFDYVTGSDISTSRGIVLGGLTANQSTPLPPPATPQPIPPYTTLPNDRGQYKVARKCTFGKVHGRVYAERGSRNSILAPINSESSFVIVEDGAVLHYEGLDRTTGQIWQGYRFPMKTDITLAIRTGVAVAGTPVIGPVGTALGLEGIAFDAATDESWQWVIGRNQKLTGTTASTFSRIVAVQLSGMRSSASGVGNGNVRLKVEFAPRGETIPVVTTAFPTSGAGTETFTHATDVSGSNLTMEFFTFTLTNPYHVQTDYNYLFRLTRMGTDGLDTYANDYVITNDITLFVVNDVAPGDTTPKDIASITLSNPIKITTKNPHLCISGTLIYIQNISTTVELNNKYYTVTGVVDDLVDGSPALKTLSLLSIDGTTGYTAPGPPYDPGPPLVPGPGGTLTMVNRYQVSNDTIPGDVH